MTRTGLFEGDRRTGLTGVFGHIGQSIESSHGADFLDCIFSLVILPRLEIKHAFGVQLEVLDHKGIHSLSLDILVTVILPWEMGILDLVKGAKILVHRLSLRILDLRRILGPVAPHGN